MFNILSVGLERILGILSRINTLAVGDIITELFQALQAIVTGLLALLVSSTSGVIAIFWSETLGFTIYGVFLLIGMGLFFVMFAWRVIQGFIRK